MTRLTTLVLLVASMFIVACEEQKSAAPAAGDTKAAAPLKDDEVFIEADFAEEAQKDITPATYKSEVDALEKEISAE